MGEFRLVHAGLDKLDAAFQGTMMSELFSLLNAGKEAAQRQDEPYAIHIGPGRVAAHVHDRGMAGGYAFRLNTGPAGANYFIKDDVRMKEWNFFMASLSEGLLAYGYRDYWQGCLQTLKDMGALVVQESINRVDLALDFATTGFELQPDLFVAPPRTKNTSHYGQCKGPHDDNRPQIVTAGRNVESITIGRMPGRQVIVYDKRAEAIAKGNLHWFEVWGIDPKDRDTQVWRIELRAGKHHLKQDFGLSTFQDVDDSIGDVFKKMIQDIRYLEAKQTDTNVTRARLHTLWNVVEGGLDRALAGQRSGLSPGRMIEIEREKQRVRYIDNIAGNAAGLAVVDGRTFRQALENLPDDIALTLRTRFEENPRKLAEKMTRAEKRYSFLTSELPPMPN